MRPFHEILKESRKSAQLTQVQLSSALNLSQASYQRYEKGDREPSITTLINIANILNMPIDILVGRYVNVSQ
jgi:transcriptional regulator with XRE-family HTH domain